MQANEAIEKLRAALDQVGAYCAYVHANAQLRGVGPAMAAVARDALAATATIDPPAIPVLAAVGVEAQQQGNAIRPSAEPAGQLDVDDVTCDQYIELEGELHREYARQAIARIRKEAHGLLRYEFRNGIEAACEQMERLLNLNDESSSTAGAAKGGNTTPEVPAAQPAADHAKRAKGEREAFGAIPASLNPLNCNDKASDQAADSASIKKRAESTNPKGWERNEFEKWAGYHYRNVDEYTTHDHDIGFVAWQARGQQAGASADMIAKIVDRDTPPDNRNEVIDHDLAGKPITRGMVGAWSSAKAERARKAQIKRNGADR